MKKFKIFAALAATALTFTACNNPGKPNDNDEVKYTVTDSLSYLCGLVNGNSLVDYEKRDYAMDSAQTELFIKGIKEGTKIINDTTMAVYYEGIKRGMNLAKDLLSSENYRIFGEDTTRTLSDEKFLEGLINGIRRNNSGLTHEEILQLVNQKTDAVKKQVHESEIKEGEDFLKANAKKEGVHVTNSGLQYKIIKQGSGTVPTLESYVNIKYIAKLIDGTVVDNENREEIIINVRRNTEGIKEVLQLMPVGSKWEAYIPYTLAYGNRSEGKIPPYATLIYEIEILSIVK